MKENITKILRLVNVKLNIDFLINQDRSCVEASSRVYPCSAAIIVIDYNKTHFKLNEQILLTKTRKESTLFDFS